MRPPLAERTFRLSIPAIAIAVVSLAPGKTEDSASRIVEASVVYRTPDGIYVDAGAEAGLRRGQRGRLVRDGETIVAIEVVEVSTSWTLLRPRAGGQRENVAPGDRVELIVEESDESAPPAPNGASERSPTLRSGEERGDDFTPLLALVKNPAVPVSRSANRAHGNVWGRQSIQLDPGGDDEVSRTRVGSSGTVERIGGTAWSAEWSAETSWLGGGGIDGVRHEDELRFLVRRLSAQRRFGDDTTLRVGRFLPREVPAVGWVDGVQGETPLGEHVRLGGVLGLKPTRTRLDLSADEPVVAPYLTWLAGEPGGVRYSGTTGLLASLYEGEPDRLALLLDQHLRFGRELLLHGTSQIDFDLAMDSRSGTRITELDVWAGWRPLSDHELRIGLDHYEQPDTAATRDAFDFRPDPSDRGLWRAWVGASHELPGALTLGEEVAILDSPGEDLDPLVQVSLARRGLPGLSAGSAALTLYNLDGLGAGGYGARLSAFLPFAEGRISVDPTIGLRWVDADIGDELTITDIGVRARWALSNGWSVEGGIAWTDATDGERYVVDLGLRLRW